MSNPEPWNHNQHYHRLVLAAVTPDCQAALDVGCGQGALTRRLIPVVPQVTGIDRDERSIEIARAHRHAADVTYMCSDFRAPIFQLESFDLVASVASLHHMDAEATLRRMAELLRQGGVLVVIGLARDPWPVHVCVSVPAAIGRRLRLATYGWRQRQAARLASEGYQSPVVWPPPLTYRQMRELSEHVLPGSRFRRRLYWRYSLVWTKPPG